LEAGTQAEHLNDTITGCTLDALQSYETTELFSQQAYQREVKRLYGLWEEK